MTWLALLVLLVTAMIVLEAAGAERNFRRSRDPLEMDEADFALLDELLLGRRG